MKAVLLHQSIHKHDAIGNDIAHMYHLLGQNHEVCVYCDHLFNPGLKQIDRKELLNILSDEDNLILYHHSNHWEEGEALLDRTKAKVIIRYHCITPESFFQPYSNHCYLLCKNGREQTARMYKKYPEVLWMAASFHNIVDAGIHDATQAVVVPPFHNLEQWKDTVPEESILSSLMESPGIKLLFVGRVCPHKGHRFLMEIVRDFTSYYGTDISLYIVGKTDPELGPYNEELAQMIADYRLEDQVIWVSEVNDATLLSYYLGCDFYVNCSDHEGFCVPVVEAQSLCLPVISKRTSAIPETMGREQLMLGHDPMDYTAAIHLLSQDDEVRDYLVRMGRENYQNRFSTPVIQETFVEAVENFTGVRL